MSNVIYQGSDRAKDTVNLAVAAQTLPGVVVSISSGKFAVATSGEGRLLALSNRQFIDDDINTAYEADETAIAWEIDSEDEFYLRAVTGNYTDQQELTVGAGGLLKAAAAADVVVAFADGAQNLAADGFLNVIAADKYTKG